MSRAKLFLENMMVYGLGSMIAKAVPLIMLPIVTSLMPNARFFGISDLSNTLVSLVQPVAVMGMYDAMFRMYFDSEEADFRLRVCSTALYFVLGTAIVVFSTILLLNDPIAKMFFGSAEFTGLVIVSAVTIVASAVNQIAQAPTRMNNRRGVYLVMNTATAVLSYSISIPLLMAGQYLIALPVAALIAAASSLAVFLAINRGSFSLAHFDSHLLRKMMCVGIPLMPSFLFYWVFNSSSRLVIVSVLGTSAAGIFAVAAKVGQVSQLIYNAFAQGWQYFAFSTMGDDDQVTLNSRVFEYLGVFSCIATVAVIICMHPAYGTLFSEEYYSGISCVPYLFLAPLMLMLYQIAVNQLVIVKKTWPSLIMLACGAIACFGLQLFLVPRIGIEGAAIGTIAGYAVTTFLSLFILSRMGLMVVRKRFFLIAGLFSSYFVFWRFYSFESVSMLAIVGAIFIFICLFVYKTELRSIMQRIKCSRN